MASSDIYISNGTCYSAAGKKLGDNFLPCGNDGLGHVTCCGAGDNCLADHACFGIHGSGYGSYLTYMAGCSDPDYQDATCPEKHIDQAWIALTLCDDSGGEWAVCSQQGNPTTLQPGSYCSCTDAKSATIAFGDATSLANICSLPQSVGGSIQFFPGHSPTSSSSPTTTEISQSTRSSSGNTTPAGTVSSTSPKTTAPAQNSNPASGSVTPSTTNPYTSGISSSNSASSDSPSSDGGGVVPSDSGTSTGLSTGVKTGIGIGAGVGGLILIAGIVALVLLIHRRRQNPQDGIENSKKQFVVHRVMRRGILKLSSLGFTARYLADGMTVSASISI